MARIVIAFASFDGQTTRIAERIGVALAHAGHAVRLLAADSAEARERIEDSDAVIVGSAIRYGHHPRWLEDLVRNRKSALAARPNAFFSVCLSAGGPGAKPEVARAYVADFCRRTGWYPRESVSFGGALRYRQYNLFIRLMMRLIVGFAGGETDTSRDHEYTDWQAVERFAARFAVSLEIAAAA